MDYNILVLSAGRRVELIQCFKDAARRLNIPCKMYAADMCRLAPAVYFADGHRILPEIKEDGYIKEIIRLCNEESIALIVPTIDTELRVLARNKAFIESRTGAKVLISDTDVIDICTDKRKTYKFFIRNGFFTPKLIEKADVLRGEYEFPLFIKPVNGSSSINAFKINTKEELLFFQSYVRDPLIQEFVHGEEYTIDAFCDFDSDIISITPRLRIAVRNGEILKGKIVKDAEIIENTKKLLALLRPVGQITIQCIKAQKGIYFIEINPRFGGGAPMSIMAGADSCEYLFRISRGEKLRYCDDAQNHLTFLRFDHCVCLDKDMEPAR